MGFEIEDCTAEEMNDICSKLVEYNLQQVPKTQQTACIRIHKKIADENRTVIAGCLAKIYYWHIVHVDVLWVDEKYRKMGWGSRLLKEIEHTAAQQGCSLIHLDTFDFQAKDFYLRHGYELFGTLEDCPENHCRYYLKKKLEPGRKC